MPFDVRSPISTDQLARLDDRPETVQFSSALTDADYQVLGEWFRVNPAKTLRAYGSYDGTIKDLDFLQHFPTVRSFAVDGLYESLTNIEGLGHLPDDVRFLSIGRTKKKLSLRPVARFLELRGLQLEGQTKDIEVVSGLHELRSLTLRSITLRDLSLLKPLTNLKSLALKLGGTRDLSVLPELVGLEHLELWMVKGLSDLAPVAHVLGLRHLHLESLRQVEVLPNLERLSSLERLWLQNLKGITDLSAVRTAPDLRHLAVVDMTHLQPDAFRPLQGHPTLASLRHGLGSTSKNLAVKKIIDLEPGGDWRRPTYV